MHWIKLIPALIVVLVSGCNETYVKPVKMSAAEKYPDHEGHKFISLTNAVKDISATPLDKIPTGLIPIDFSSECKILISSEKLACFFIENNDSNIRLDIKSHVVADNDGKPFLFYPAITAFSDTSNKFEELTPEYELNMKGSTLTNNFNIPPGTSHILIHTRKRYLGMTFPIVGESDSGNGYLAMAGLVLGGAIGGAIYAANQGYSSVDTEYTLAPVGYIEISLK
ncbi:MAG: hypothetical protein PVG66_06755 [Chromatiales bacterium]|jgi:hypothetical protein